jgi:RNA polymerase primary sigma factor/RNA polymerase sigma factor
MVATLRPSSTPETKRPTLLMTPVEYVPSTSFADRCVRVELRKAQLHSTPPPGDPTVRLSAEEERELFLLMNFLRWVAERTRRKARRLGERRATRRIRLLLRRANATRNRIVQANLRLAGSTIKRYFSQAGDYRDLMSDAVLTLIRACDRFDVSRGFRFSTYAVWAIRNNLAYESQRERKRSTRFVNTPGLDHVLPAPPPAPPLVGPASHGKLARAVRRMLGQLDPRERSIVEARYGIGRDEGPASLSEIGEQMGISKERVRQLEARAMDKVTRQAIELRLNRLIDGADDERRA